MTKDSVWLPVVSSGKTVVRFDCGCVLVSPPTLETITECPLHGPKGVSA